MGSQGSGINRDVCFTVNAVDNHAVVLVYESHGQDCRYIPLGDTCYTISQKYGTGGGQRADSSEV